MRHLVPWLPVILLVAAVSAGAQVNNSGQGPLSPVSAADEGATPRSPGEVPGTSTTLSPEITITGIKPPVEPTLPKIPPDQFTDCMATGSPGGIDALDLVTMKLCELQLAKDERIVIDKCTNRDGKIEPPAAIQACAELLDRNVLRGHERFYLFVNRALAYFALGDKQHALDDYNTAVTVAPKKAQPYYYRALFYAAQTDVGAALRDLDTALSINPKLVPALLQRAKVHKTQNDLTAAIADYSEAIRLEPATTAAWSERGYVCLLQHDYESAIRDEAQAIKLDATLARAWYLRGAAYGDLGNAQNAVSDVKTAVGIDPSLSRYISIKGKAVTLGLPPL
jgi:tetratricopeptide (TPR) repeat protein